MTKSNDTAISLIYDPPSYATTNAHNPLVSFHEIFYFLPLANDRREKKDKNNIQMPHHMHLF